MQIDKAIRILEGIRGYQSEGFYKDAVSAGIAALREIGKSNWIPCSERMPVRCDPVMILTDDGSYAIAHTTENEDEYLWFGDGGHYSKDCVLFWMSLPEPPKGVT